MCGGLTCSPMCSSSVLSARDAAAEVTWLRACGLFTPLFGTDLHASNAHTLAPHRQWHHRQVHMYLVRHAVKIECMHRSRHAGSLSCNVQCLSIASACEGSSQQRQLNACISLQCGMLHVGHAGRQLTRSLVPLRWYAHCSAHSCPVLRHLPGSPALPWWAPRRRALAAAESVLQLPGV